MGGSSRGILDKNNISQDKLRLSPSFPAKKASDRDHSREDVQVSTSTIQTQVERIGASSGWDMLAGMSLVLRAL